MWLYASSTSTGSNIRMAWIIPWHTAQPSIHPVLWRVAGNNCIWDCAVTGAWIPVIGRHARTTPMLSSLCLHINNRNSCNADSGFLENQWTHFDDQVSVYSLQQVFSAIWKSVSGLSKYHAIRTVSNIFAKRGLLSETLLILALPVSRNLWLFPISTPLFSPNSWSRSGASQDLVWPFALGLLMNASQASCMTCGMHGMWVLSAGHSVTEAPSVDCSSGVME